MSQLTCPACQSAMNKELVNGFELDVCPGCLGVWFDEGELGKVAKLPKQNFESRQPATPLPLSHLKRSCPRCSALLLSAKYQYTSDITIDSCEQCGGVFVDQGELEEIREFIERAKTMTPVQRTAAASGRIDSMKITSKARQKSADMAMHSRYSTMNPVDLAISFSHQYIHDFWDPSDFS